ncbi:extracellular solute-binding protein [Paractinoplanes rishiriensis]|uniref:Lipoprotein LipO n=1 Tax=Paractinoplanes rishiriensis TaxID=1050105 RepID=A0A919JY00_9ACTN|nr:extracellular solute-binding protein [Actinoplanes rishiriensis]GIE95367.1 lipoprotein LipO [Actinoplanes rishiriensis]
MKIRRLAAAALALSTALTVTACGDDEQAADLDTLTIMSNLHGTAPNPNGEMQKAVEALIGKKLDITWVPNPDYGDKSNVTLASNKLPDIMVANEKAPAFIKAAEAGAFWDLTGKLDQYENLKPADPQIAKNVQVNGKTWGIYRARPLLRSSVTYRKDWLAKVGLPEPESVPDLYKVAKAFTEQDPDGNGKKDTYGLIIPKWPGGYSSSSPYDAFETWHGAPNGWGERNGKLVPGFDTEEFLTANRELKKWIDEGLVNPDFATLDTGNWMDPFVQGKGGIIIDVNIKSTDLFNLFKEKDPKDFDKVVQTGNLKRADGQKFSLPFSGYLNVLAISKQRIKTEEQLNEVLAVLNKLQSKEGSVLLTNGIEGRNFKAEGEYAVPINQEDPAVKLIENDVDKAFIQLGTRSSVGTTAYEEKPVDEAKAALIEERKQLMVEDLKTAVHNPALGVVAPTAVQVGANIEKIVSDARVKYLSGTIDEAGLKAEIQRWYDGGGTKIAQEVNELVKK